MPNKEWYAKYKAQGGAEFLRQQSIRACEYQKRNKDKINARRRNSIAEQVTRIKRQAANRDYAFELSDEATKTLLKSHCYYCGSHADPFNTIDRLDNNKGYLLDNVAACCATCNMAKGCLDPTTFIERCGHISATHWGPGELCDSCWSDTSPAGVTQDIYKRSAKRKKMMYELTEEQFDTLTTGPCTYCQRPCTETHKNGIDRLDVAYTAETCVTACGQCNVAKKTLGSKEFIQLMQAVARTQQETPRDHTAIPRCKFIITRRNVKVKVKL